MAFNEIRPFRYWCNKVLPMVYDDSLSYYELLCKVVKHLNDIGSGVNSLGENVQFVYEEFNKFIKDFEGAVDDVVEESLDRFIREGMVVTSVNGQKGYVVINALPNPNAITFSGAVTGRYDGSAPFEVVIPEGGGTGNVDSVNGQEGVVVLDAEDVGAVKSAGWSGEDAGKVLGVDGEGNVVAVNGGTGAVRSVNGYTGDVVIDATDIGAVPGEGWSSADNGKFLKIDSNGDVVAVASSGDVVVAGVSSVNGQTGDVTIAKLPSPGTLTFSGGASGSYDGSEDVTVVIPEQQEIPEALPNPNALVFSGAVSGRYDGSQQVTVNVPDRSPTPSSIQFTGGSQASFDGSAPAVVEIPTKLPTVHPLVFEGAVSASYDGSVPLTVNIPAGGGTSSGLKYFGTFHINTSEGQGAGNVTKSLPPTYIPKTNDLYVIEYYPYNNTGYTGEPPYTMVARGTGLHGSRSNIALTAIFLGEYGATHALYRNVGINFAEDGTSLTITYGNGYKASIGQSGAATANNTAIGIKSIAVYGFR